MIKNKNISWTDIKKEIEKFGAEKCKRIATQIRNDLTDTAANAIANFYASYNPISYQRHYWNFEEHSFKKFYTNNNNRRFIGGVQLTPGFMYDLYEDDVFTVFESVYAGYHGPIYKMSGSNSRVKFQPPRMLPSPMDIILAKRDSIIQQLENHTYKVKL